MLRDEESEGLVVKNMSERTSETKTSSPSSSSVGALVKTCAALAMVGLVASVVYINYPTSSMTTLTNFAGQSGGGGGGGGGSGSGSGGASPHVSSNSNSNSGSGNNAGGSTSTTTTQQQGGSGKGSTPMKSSGNSASTTTKNMKSSNPANTETESSTEEGAVEESSTITEESPTDADVVTEEVVATSTTETTDAAATTTSTVVATAAALTTTMQSKSSSSSSSSSSTKTRPNIVFILADDLGYGSLSEDVSPFMWDLQTNGVKLEKYYSQEACTPARAALLTGRIPLTIGLQYYEHSVDESGGLGLEETTVAEVFQAAGYDTYMFGKWNLGNGSPRYLPTARGFDYFLGYMDGFNSYWSKNTPDIPEFRDFLFSDNMCYYMYDAEDVTTYSTTLYQDKAVSVINFHDFTTKPLFMYMAFQAVHDPFSEADYPDGIPDDYLDKKVRKHIEKHIVGGMQQQYYKSLALLDKAVENMYNALDERGVVDNSYIIFASDNGGCPSGGGRNYPLRGTKGSLFEGGVHVEAFIYSPTLLKAASGSTYSNLFHVSDWFPTMLAMTGIAYMPSTAYALDGVSHYESLLEDGNDSPRPYLLMNYYFDPYRKEDTMWTNKAVAIRNSQYKLAHLYTSAGSSTWYTQDALNENDDELGRHTGCGQVNAVNNGEFTKFLFDLDNDPSETTNLYNKNSKMEAVQKELYAEIDRLAENADNIAAGVPSPECLAVWKRKSNYVVPWLDAESEEDGLSIRASQKTFPRSCGLYSAYSGVGSRRRQLEMVNDVVKAVTWTP